jgi:predicted NAD/FAD-dependent oxidoreductase
MSWLIRDVLIVPPLGEMPFDGWVETLDDQIAAVGRDARRAPRRPSSDRWRWQRSNPWPRQYARALSFKPYARQRRGYDA